MSAAEEEARALAYLEAERRREAAARAREAALRGSGVQRDALDDAWAPLAKGRVTPRA